MGIYSMDGKMAKPLRYVKGWRDASKPIPINTSSTAVLTAFGICSLTGKDLLLGSLYVINFWEGRSWDFGHLWSLAVEEQFYLLWPATVAILGRKKAMRRAAWLVVLVPVGRALWGVLKPYRAVLIFVASPNADALLVGCLLVGWGEELRTRSVVFGISALPMVLSRPGHDCAAERRSYVLAVSSLALADEHRHRDLH